MSSFGQRIRPYVQAELEAAQRSEDAGDPASAFRHLERAHVLGQASTAQHVRVHWRMLLWGLRHRSARECAGQVVRIVGAATKTFAGMVPAGNTGGSNISALKTLPVPADLQALIRKAHGREG